MLMLSSRSTLVDNLTEELNSNWKDYKSCLDYVKDKDELLIFKCLKYKTMKKIIENLIKRFAGTYEFCNEDINKFCLMLRNGV